MDHAKENTDSSDSSSDNGLDMEDNPSLVIEEDEGNGTEVLVQEELKIMVILPACISMEDSEVESAENGSDSDAAPDQADSRRSCSLDTISQW
jgi:hypothetical protein